MLLFAMVANKNDGQIVMKFVNFKNRQRKKVRK